MLGSRQDKFAVIFLLSRSTNHSNSNSESLPRKTVKNLTPSTTPPLTNAFTCQKEDFDKFKDEVLSQLSEKIKLQDQHPTYQRPKLESVTNERINPPVVLNQPPEEIEFYAEGATFYAYNAEGVRDYGWGCAWRAIQACLSSYDIMIPPFADLFHLFGPPQNLRRVYQDKYPNENLSTSDYG